jgi:hypothetical protein
VSGAGGSGPRSIGPGTGQDVGEDLGRLSPGHAEAPVEDEERHTGGPERPGLSLVRQHVGPERVVGQCLVGDLGAEACVGPEPDQGLRVTEVLALAEVAP